jgi:hypothetical protein
MIFPGLCQIFSLEQRFFFPHFRFQCDIISKRIEKSIEEQCKFIFYFALQFFSPLVLRGINIIYDDSSRPSGTAKVYFTSLDDLTQAMGKVSS